MAKKNTLDRSFEAALKAAAKAGGPDISFGAVRARVGRGKTHVRYVGDARVDVTYKTMREESGGALRPMYRVVITVGKLKHKMTVGGGTNWHAEHVSPSSAEAIDAIAGSAIRFGSTPDEDVPDHVAETINSATQYAILGANEYQVRRAK